MQNVFQRSVAAMLLIVCVVLLSPAVAEDAIQDTVAYAVLCQPDSCVTVRSSPDSHAGEEGYLFLGDVVAVDRMAKDKSGYLWAHCVELSVEAGAGWVFMGYLGSASVTVYEEDVAATVVSKGRLAARRFMGGDVRKWLKPDSEVKVYAEDGAWAVTSEGFVKLAYLIFADEGRAHE